MIKIDLKKLKEVEKQYEDSKTCSITLINMVNNLTKHTGISLERDIFYNTLIELEILVTDEKKIILDSKQLNS